jgi:hypothetical protein
MQDCRQPQVHWHHWRHPSEMYTYPSHVMLLRSSVQTLCRGQPSVVPHAILQVALALDLQRRLDSSGANVKCFAADPGEVLTDITRTLPPPLRSMYRALLPWILFTPAQGEVAAMSRFVPDSFCCAANCNTAISWSAYRSALIPAAGADVRYASA